MYMYKHGFLKMFAITNVTINSCCKNPGYAPAIQYTCTLYSVQYVLYHLVVTLKCRQQACTITILSCNGTRTSQTIPSTINTRVNIHGNSQCELRTMSESTMLLLFLPATHPPSWHKSLNANIPSNRETETRFHTHLQFTCKLYKDATWTGLSCMYVASSE